MVARKVWLVSLLAVALCGCGGKYFEYQDPKDIPPGPGLFSGSEGAFTFSTDKKKSTTEVASSDEVRELEALREFRRWKASSADTAEYREFQAWWEWKQRQTK